MRLVLACLSFLCISVVIAAPYGRSSLPFTQIVLFGDELSTQQARTSWPQLMSEKLRIPLIDYSQAGSTIDNQLVEATNDDDHPIPSVLDQIQDYIGMNTESDLPQTTLFVVSTGTNEYVNDPSVDAALVASKIEAGVKALEKIGGRSFVLVAPNTIASPETTPSNDDEYDDDEEEIEDEEYDDPDFAQQDEEEAEASELYFFSLRRQLKQVNDRLSHSLRSRRVESVLVDLYRLYNTIALRPEEYGFAFVSGQTLRTPCVKESSFTMQGEQIRCADPTQRLFHTRHLPTDVGHEKIATEVVRAVEYYWNPWRVNPLERRR